MIGVTKSASRDLLTGYLSDASLHVVPFGNNGANQGIDFFFLSSCLRYQAKRRYAFKHARSEDCGSGVI